MTYLYEDNNNQNTKMNQPRKKEKKQDEEVCCWLVGWLVVHRHGRQQQPRHACDGAVYVEFFVFGVMDEKERLQLHSFLFCCCC